MDIKEWLSQQSHAVTSTYHMGRYCGDWKATTHHTGKPSFHLILNGKCWLHLEDKPTSFPLSDGDIVFFFSDLPFYLLSSPDKSFDVLPFKKMLPAAEVNENDTALLCGFLHPSSYEMELLFALMPEYLIITHDMDVNRKLRHIFELVKIECRSVDKNNDLTVTRLTDLLLVYVVEQVMESHFIDINLLLSARNKILAELFIRILSSPAENWSIDRMSSLTQMSRSTFIRKVQGITTYSPNEVVTRLRINVASSKLLRGWSVEEAASEIGYESVAGFCRSFKKITRCTPAGFSKVLAKKIGVNETYKK
ncbi:AraC family transcriptional regulator [Escherichia coli]|uniref:AraC family transcriptional regulator n=1 Tax=Escherichia coli TaxID=562 RepID=UPI001650436F|nr:AraC family transcriptional regulator [Escherichia coli]MBC6572883.1 AraC family transcriptional regulator [Escherichia coli]